ncbi:peptidoglycan-binding protein [Nocardioides sp. R1-1]|uniref:peptidoglycan-binding protein n=1 Tax=Nocardioides sp. R1-1 TaxID=3383502 RepID=UPI0038D187D1
MRTGYVVGGACLVIALAAGTVTAVGTDSDPGAAPDDGAAGAATTVPVRRGDLVETTSASGSLEYGAGHDLATHLAGTVTWLPREGRTIREGGRLWEVDRSPVFRLDGRVPAWRDLEPGMDDGRDVRQLEAALSDLGYPEDATLEVDEEWTWATTRAVRQWQEDHELEETGRLPLGSVVFTDGDQRVASTAVTVGDQVQPGTTVLATSTDERRVRVELEPSRRSLAAPGAVVELRFADGTTARGRVTDVETVPPEDEKSEEMLAVTIEPGGRKARRAMGAQLDGASTLVSFSGVLAEDVLIVPVSALVALAGGGYGVEVVDDDGRRLVEVATQGFGDTTAAVSGDLDEGDQVVVTP